MAEFIDRQAEESDRESSDDDSDARSEGSAAEGRDSDEGPVAKKRKTDAGGKKKKKLNKNKKRMIESSDEDEDDAEEDEDKAKEEMKGFIASDDEIEEEGDNDDVNSKSDKSNDDEDEDLNDDLDLVNENLGRSKQHRVQISDSESDEDDRTKIQKKLFGENEGDEDERSERGEDDRRREAYSDRSEDDSEDDFIVNEHGHKKRRNRERNANLPVGALDDAREIFGVADFNFDDFFEDEQLDEGDLEDEEEEVVDEDDEGQEIRVRRLKARGKKSTLYETLDPAELERGFLSATDKRIQIEDMPERFQTRRIPVTEATEEEIASEAAWILKYGFKERPLTNQEECLATKNLRDAERHRDDSYEQCLFQSIRAALQFLRAKGKENFEVPFINCYRKEAIRHPATGEEILSLDDLWRVYEYDEKWCHLNTRKTKFVELMKRMQLFMQEVAQHEYVYREIPDEEIDAAERLDSLERLIDMNAAFQMYYGNEMGRMLEWEKAKEAQAALETGGDDAIFNPVSAHYKLSTRNDKFQTCVNNGIGRMVEKFGLTAAQVADNLEWRKHEVEQDPNPPLLVAEEFVTSVFPDPESVIQAAIFMMAKEISRHPQVREFVRRCYRDRVFVNARLTKKGREQFDENSPIYEKRYLKEKPVTVFEGDEYLYFHQMVSSGMMELVFGYDRENMRVSLEHTILQEQPFKKDEFSDVVEEWNALRDRVMQMAIHDMLLPYLETETKQKMLEEAQEAVTRKCNEYMKTKLEVAAFQPSDDLLEDDTEEMKRKGEIRVLGIAYSTDPAIASFGAMVNEEGVVTDFVKLQHFTKRKFGPPQQADLKRETMLEFEKFFIKNRPHIIAISAVDMDALNRKRDVEDSLNEIRDNFSTGKDRLEINALPQVYLIDSEPAKIFAASKMSSTEFADYPELLKEAIGLARLTLDPLPVYSWLWNAEDDILCLKMAPLQSEVDKEALKWAVSKELINQVNAVGVDLNKCLEYPHYANTLQFICGLGPRKAAYILKILKQNDNLIESRSKLVMTCKLGPKVFMNCSGFIRLDTAKISERTEAYVEVLDGTRIHPETYEWARKMAVDALEVDDSSDPTSALMDIMEAPERLKDLDLDAFAEELKRQGYGEKKATLYDIAAELNHRFKDLRRPLMHIQNSDLFDLLNRGNKPLKVKQIVKGVVVNVQYSNKKLQELPIAYMADDGYFHCPRCKVFKGIQPQDVMDHLENDNFRAGGCPGDPVGLRVRLENGIVGFVPIQMISKDRVDNPLDRVQPGQTVSCVVMDVDKDRFSYKLSTRSTDLMSASNQTEERDHYFDMEAFEKDEEEMRDTSERKKKATAYVRRVIKHPSFFNVGYADAERMLAKMDPGEAIIRPSSKSPDKLTITWKVADGVLNNIEVDELDKDNVFSRGRRFRIGNEDFEDFDEMLTRYVQPMATYANEVMTHKCYLVEHYFERDKDHIEMRLIDERRANPSRIPYVFSVSRDFPGKFILSYYVSTKCRHEYFSMTPEGIKFRQTIFKSLERMMGWFKQNYRQPPPGTRPYYR